MRALWLFAGCWAAARASGGAVGGAADEPPVSTFMRETTAALAWQRAAHSAHAAHAATPKDLAART